MFSSERKHTYGLDDKTLALAEKIFARPQAGFFNEIQQLREDIKKMANRQEEILEAVKAGDQATIATIVAEAAEVKAYFDRKLTLQAEFDALKAEDAAKTAAIEDYKQQVAALATQVVDSSVVDALNQSTADRILKIQNIFTAPVEPTAVSTDNPAPTPLPVQDAPTQELPETTQDVADSTDDVTTSEVVNN